MTDENRTSNSFPAVEWVIVAIGFILTIGLFGYIGWQAVTANEKALPQITVEVGETRPYPGGWVVAVTARNQSPQTAADVEIEGTLRSGGDETKATATLTYIPGNSSQRAGLFFPEDPAGGTLEVRPLGYQVP